MAEDDVPTRAEIAAILETENDKPQNRARPNRRAPNNEHRTAVLQFLQGKKLPIRTQNLIISDLASYEEYEKPIYPSRQV